MGSPDYLQSCARNASRRISAFKSIYMDGKMIFLIYYVTSEVQNLSVGLLWVRLNLLSLFHTYS